ncbi:hypothetical protein [Carnobacterium sp. ISL-102]|uniref:hypothetical protein n=1 Tax=Carnobacterium sp. ISL-102 TaxID=2819142 RepID=UPI001BE7ACD3|nr:hypothetical protein [Carnobacterium sp. ISL-102]MBT2732090.1 hypothetical protein [Carnobacterium sp. ISL-102]
MSKQTDKIKQANNFLLKSEQKMLGTLLKVESTCMKVVQIHRMAFSNKEYKSQQVQLAEEILETIDKGWESNEHADH